MEELWRKKAEELIRAVALWGREKNADRSILLVGSYARGSCRPDSDIDFCILSRDREQLLRDQKFIHLFGKVRKKQTEDYGGCISIRAWYEEGPEVEFGLILPEWVALPLDPGTERVLRDGYLVLADESGVFDLPELPAPTGKYREIQEERKE